MPSPLIYIVVVNWNLKDVTLDCLESLFQLKYPYFKVVVVDNASGDGSPAEIAARFPQVEQIQNSENLGSTAGYNQGFRWALQAGAAYVMLINNDTYIDPEALDHLLQAHTQEEVALSGPLIYYADYPGKVWSAGAMRNPLTLELMNNHGRKQTFTGITERDFLTSCALLFSRRALQEVGLMDGDYFIYQEENDYCLRVKRAGFKMLLVPQAKVWHRVSLSSGGSESLTERYWMAKNTMILFRKHARWWNWFFIVPWRGGSILKNTVRMILKRNWKGLRAFWRGLRDGIKFPLRQKSSSTAQSVLRG
jgi:hypothetical protein